MAIVRSARVDGCGESSATTVAHSTITTANVAVPNCTDLGTSSSSVRADGKTVGFDANGTPAFVGMNPAGAFGCQ